MSKPRILVTGASGKTGGETAAELLKRKYPVRALVHREDHRSKWLRDAGAEIIIGDMQSIEEMNAAMKGVQRAYFVCPWTQNQLDVGLNFAIAAAENRVEHVVAMSQWLSSSVHSSVATRRTWLLDRAFAWLPETSLTLINVGFFADNYMALLEPISQLGMLPMPLGEGLNAPVSNGDIGRSIAAALTDPAQHAGKTYRPCGPELLTPTQIADTFGNVLGRRVKYQNISEKMFLKATKAMGLPTGLLSQLRIYFAEYREGTFAAGAPNDAVPHLTGREPEDFESIVRDYVHRGAVSTGLVPSIVQLPSTRRTAGNLARALLNFSRLLLTRAPDVDGYVRDQQFPRVREARLALQDQTWVSSHDLPNAYGAETTEIAIA